MIDKAIHLNSFKDVDVNRLHDKEYRLDNFYYIIDKDRNRTLFNMNPVQRDCHRNRHNRNIVLKARQLGMSTFWILDLLDEALWNDNTGCGIVSYSREHSSHIFKKIIGYAIDNLPPWLELGIKSRSTTEIQLSNHSLLRVDTTLRGGSYPNVVVTEFGKTCARNPIKADEVITGTLETVPMGGCVTIESTGEGSAGQYFDMVNSASVRGNDNLTPLDYKLFFYSWMDEKKYKLEQNIDYDVNMSDYFTKVEEDTGRIITRQQRNWYVTKEKTLANKMQQEYPSTVTEAFMSSSEAYYFADEFKRASDENRFISTNPYDPLAPVYIAMDIGVNDLTVMIFFQVVHGEIRIFDYYKDNNKGVDFYASFLLKDKPYHYNTIFLPHDSVKRSELDVTRNYKGDFEKLFTGTDTVFSLLPSMDKQASISNTKTKLRRMVFNQNRCKKLIEHCMKYRKKWSEPLGKYLEEPLPDIHDHYADALIYTAQSIGIIERGINITSAMEQHMELVDNRCFSI